MFKPEMIRAMLRKTPLFQGLSDRELLEIGSLLRVKEYGRGAMVFLAGEKATGFYLVLRGRVKVYRLAPGGKELILHVVDPGSSFAEAALLMGGEYPAFATTLAASTLAFFPREAFLGAVERNPRLALGMVTSMAHWLRRMRELLEDLTLRDVDARLAGYVLDLAAAAPAAPGGAPTIEIAEDRGTLASRLGTIRETLSRSLRRFQDKGILAVKGRRIRIADADALRRIREGVPPLRAGLGGGAEALAERRDAPR